MLTNSSMLSDDQEDEDIRCPLCSFYFSSTTKPYLLPCNHNLCLPCINNLISSNMPNCPLCSTPFSSSSIFTVNFAFLNLVSKILKSKIIYCKKCNKVYYWSEHREQCDEREFKETNDIMNEIKKLCENSILIAKYLGYHRNIINTSKNEVIGVVDSITKEIRKKSDEEQYASLKRFFDMVSEVDVKSYKEEIQKFLEICVPCCSELDIDEDDIERMINDKEIKNEEKILNEKKENNTINKESSDIIEDDIPNEKENDLNERLKINTFQNPRVNQFEKKNFDIINTNNANFPKQFSFDLDDLIEDFNTINSEKSKKINKLIVSNKGITIVHNNKEEFSENVLTTESTINMNNKVKSFYPQIMRSKCKNEKKEKRDKHNKNYESNSTIIEDFYDANINNPYNGTPLLAIQKLNQQSNLKENTIAKSITSKLLNNKSKTIETNIRQNKSFNCYNSVSLSTIRHDNNITAVNKMIKNFNKIKDIIAKLTKYISSINTLSSLLNSQIESNQLQLQPNLLFDYFSLLKDISHAFIQTQKRYIITFIDNTKTIVLYDVKRKTFSYKNIDIPSTLNISTSIVFDDCDLVFISGGICNSNTMSIYRFSNNSLEKRTLMPTPRSFHSSIYFNNTIYIIGGIGDSNYHLRECEAFSIVNHKWESMPYLNYPRANATLCIYNNRYLYVFRGSDKNSMLDTIEYIDVKNYNKGWTVYQPEDPGLSWFGCEYAEAATVDENKIIIFGGMNKKGKIFHHVFNFDPVRKTVFRMKDLKRPAVFHSSATFINGEVVGVEISNGKKDKVHCFDVKRNQWEIY